MSSSTLHDYEKPPRHPHANDKLNDFIDTGDATFDYSEKTEDHDGEGIPRTGVPVGPGAPLGLATTKTSEKLGVAATKVSTRVSVNNTSQIPNGGFKAWIQVVGSFFLFFNTW